MMSRPGIFGVLGCLVLALGPRPVLGQDIPVTGADHRASMTLAEAVALALETHPVVGQAVAAGDVAEAMVRQARSALLPVSSPSNRWQRIIIAVLYVHLWRWSRPERGFTWSR